MKKILIILILLKFSLVYSATFTTATSGVWTTGSTWVGGTAPTLTGGSKQLSDDVIIETGHTVTLSSDLTVKNGASLTVRGTLIISMAGNVDFQLGSMIFVESGGTLELNGLTNSNNSTNVTIHGSLIVNGDYTAGNGAELTGNGSMEVSGTSSGSGTSFGVVLGCDNCMVMSGGVIEDAIIDGNQTAEHAPIEPYWNWTYSQQIYYQSEINSEGNITELSFEFNGNSSFTDQVEIYLGHTTKSSFSSTSNWVSYSDLMKVYDGPYSVSNTKGWYSITFDTPFYYNNSDNLVIAVYEKTNGYHTASDEFYTGDGGTYRVLTYYDDYTNPNPASPPTADYRSRWIPSLKLKIEPAGSPLPVNLVSFTGTVLEEQIAVLLKWITATEKDNDYFTIWRSLDGYHWDVIGMEKGAGNSQSILEYIYLDRQPGPGINYYNLSQTDFNGDTEFYGIISVDVDKLVDRHYVKLRINLQGQQIKENTPGPQILVWDNGDVQKIFK
jgi:hypothetical protein